MPMKLEKMDDLAWDKNKLLSHSCGKSLSSSKMKHPRAEKFPDDSTPVSKLCASMTVATLQTPITCCGTAEEAISVETPLKISQQMHVDTPLSCANKQVDTVFQTPTLFTLCDSDKISSKCSEILLNTPISSHNNSNVETPLCFALDEVCDLKNVNTTPRRNPRRSCLNNCSVKIPDVTPSRQGRRPSILKNKCSESNLSVTKITNCESNNISNPPSLESDGKVTSQLVLNEDDILLQKKTVSDFTSSRKSLFCETGSNDVLDNALNKNLPFQINKILLNKVSSEPRFFKKTDSGSNSSRRLSFSAKKCANKQKNAIPEYDPDNDIFAHGIMPMQFNVDLLKQEIGKIFSASDISSPILKRSQSCVTLNDVHENNDVSPNRCVTSVSPGKKRSKRVTLSSSKLNRAISAPNVLVSAETEIKPSAKESSEKTMRAFLRARDIIKNLKQRVKNVCNVPNEEKKASNTQSTSANHLQSRVGNVSSQNNAVAEKCKNVEEVARKDSGKESFNCSFGDEDLASTQPFESIILRDVTAYVEVISKNEDISAGVRTELIKLGATVVPSFNRNVPVTHVIFNDGRVSTYQKAKKRNVPLVSVLWIEECRKAGLKVHESFFPPYQIERYECPSIVKELKKRKIMQFYSDDNPRPSPRQKKVVPKNAAIVPLNETPSQKISEKKCVHNPKWIDDVAGDNGMVRLLVNMTGIGHNEFKELINRPPTPDSELELEQNSPLPVRLLRKLAKNLPRKEKSDSASRPGLNENTSHTSNPCVVNSFIKKLDQMEIEPQNVETEKAEMIESVSAYHESAVICQDSPSELQNLTQRKKKETKTDKIPKSNVFERTAKTTRHSFKNSFVKKQNEILSTGKDVICNNKLESSENNVITTFQHKNADISYQDLIPQLENCESQDVSQRKKVPKRKLLSPSEKTIVDTNDVESIESENTVLENPHSQPPKQLKEGKKRKLEVVEKQPSTIVSSPEVPIRRSRRSSMYFVKVKRRCPSPIVQKPGIVCTLLHSVDMELVVNIVEKLGTFVLEKNVTSHTTHVVMGSPKRSMKVLKGMARGCWVVGQEWILKSLEANKWLDEEDFELTSFSPAVEKYRLEKLSFGGIFKPDIFSSCGRIFVSSQSRAPRGDLVELILLCGGQISSKISNAEIAVGKNRPGLVCVTHLWVLDSVQYYCCKSFDSYLYS